MKGSTINRTLTGFATAVVVSGGLGLAAMGLAQVQPTPIPGARAINNFTGIPDCGQECLPRVLLGPQVRPERAHHAVY